MLSLAPLSLIREKSITSNKNISTERQSRGTLKHITAGKTVSTKTIENPSNQSYVKQESGDREGVWGRINIKDNQAGREWTGHWLG